MKLSLRNKYFAWLLFLMLAIYVSVAAVLTDMEVHEAHLQKTPISNEAPELIAFMVVMLISLPTALLLAWLVAGRLLRPLKTMLATAERIRSGSLDERIPLPADNELAHLATTINEAFDRYATAVRRLESFSADASHQLRTPIAAIRTSAEVTLQQERSIEDYQESLAEILGQTERLNQTVDQLLLLARMDKSIRRDFKPVPLVKHLADWTTETAAMLESHTLNFEADAAAQAFTLPGNVFLLRQVFDNLINNAVAATGTTGVMHIRAELRGQSGLILRVEDSGPGIPEAERNLVFDRFFRGRNTAGKGSGLGLAIVKEIITLHGGTLRAEASASLGGAAFIITW